MGTGVTSRVDDPAFFLDKRGKTSPQAELETSLHYLFQVSSDSPSPAFCRFPARFSWLNKALDLKRNPLAKGKCPKLNNWLRNLRADSLTLIFPVSVLNSPASMFGHTFLRLDRKVEAKPDLLAWTVSYAAHSDGERGLSFALNGLFGGYPGRYNLAPYHQQVKVYSDIESRDIWEYKLNYSPAEIHAMLLHLWELLPVYSDYYFIDENCSYQLLTLLQAARPELPLVDRFYIDATPAETVSVITSTPGLLNAVNYRPSTRQVIVSRAEALDEINQALARNLALGITPLQDPHFRQTDDITQAQIIDLSSDYLMYRKMAARDIHQLGEADNPPNKGADETLEQALLHQLLTARSELNVSPIQPAVSTPNYRPDQGHRGHRLGLRYGDDQADQYLQFDIRWAYHDLYDPSSGFISGAQLEFLKPAFRYYPEHNHLEFESIDFVSIISTPPRNYFIRPFSWETSASLKRHQFSDNERALLGDIRAGAGLTYQLSKRTTTSIFANTAINIGNKFDHQIALAGGGRAELIYTHNDNWRGGLHAAVMQYFEGLTQTSYQYGGTLRFSLDQNNALVLELAEKKEFADSFFMSQLSWQFYF